MTSLFMTVFMLYMMYTWHFPSAFVLYWFVSNILMTAQQLRYMKPEPESAVSAETVVASPEPAPAAASSNPGKNHHTRKPRRRR